MMEKEKSYYNEDTRAYYSKQTGKRLHGCAEQVCRAKHEYGGIKPALDQNEQLKEALYYSVSLIHEQDKEIQHLKNILGSVLPTLNLNIPSLDFNER
ncbi:hypothetical protein KVC27_03010 [Helicobacter pylori]|nr:hypothetical protein KVC27_03010 [Helicobacter pylori]